MLRTLFILFIGVNIYAQSSDTEIWTLKRSNFYFENDMYFNTDYDYTAGIRLSWLYHVKNPRKNIYDVSPFNFGGSDTYRNFALVHQIFTPKNKSSKALQTKDRPYAGWTYFESGIHRSSASNLHSLNLRVGIVGKYSGAEFFQNALHKLIDAQHVNGWDNQLHNELGINFKYTHKRRFFFTKQNKLDLSFIPFTEIELGNVSTEMTAGFAVRVGYNIPKDFGVSSIDVGGEDGIPSHKGHLFSHKQAWSYSFNLNMATSLVARDIFLDGNTFKNSHKVNKEQMIAYGGIGFSLQYKRFVFDFIQTYNTRKFNSEDKGHDTGSIVLSWIYD